ncbi:MAG: hypothetical protein JO108_36760 [Acidobacteriaceae bacterium]|nr:hypothetical protein [Acidobacteriaceae bacterium]
MIVETRALGFRDFAGPEPHVMSYGDAKWPYRVLLAAESDPPPRRVAAIVPMRVFSARTAN